MRVTCLFVAAKHGCMKDLLEVHVLQTPTQVSQNQDRALHMYMCIITQDKGRVDRKVSAACLDAGLWRHDQPAGKRAQINCEGFEGLSAEAVGPAVLAGRLCGSAARAAAAHATLTAVWYAPLVVVVAMFPSVCIGQSGIAWARAWMKAGWA